VVVVVVVAVGEERKKGLRQIWSKKKPSGCGCGKRKNNYLC